MKKHAAPHRSFTMFLLAFGAFFLLFGAVCFGSLRSLKQQSDDATPLEATAMNKTEVPRFTEDNARHLLLILQDQEKAQGFAILRLDPANIRAYLLSVPPETELHGDDGSVRPLCEAFRKEELPFLTQALSKELELPLHHYLSLSYDALQEAISYLGNGLVFTLNEPVTVQDSDGYSLRLSGGTQTLTASQVISVLRYDAWHDGFRQRCAVQGEILAALFNQYLIPERTGKLEEDFSALIDRVSSDIRIAEFTDMKDGLCYLAERNEKKALVTELTLNGHYETREEQRHFVPLAATAQGWYAVFGKEAPLP